MEKPVDHLLQEEAILATSTTFSHQKKRALSESEPESSMMTISSQKRQFQEDFALIPILQESCPPRTDFSTQDLFDMVMNLTQELRALRQSHQELETTVQDQREEITVLKNELLLLNSTRREGQVPTAVNNSPAATTLSTEPSSRGTHRVDGHRSHHPLPTSPSSNYSPATATTMRSVNAHHLPSMTSYAQKVRTTPPASRPILSSDPTPLNPSTSTPTDRPPPYTPRRRERVPVNPHTARVRSLLPPLPQTDGTNSAVASGLHVPSPEERIQLLFAPAPTSSNSSSSSSDTPPAPSTTPMVTCVRVREDRFSKECRRAPREAWRLLLREKARTLQPPFSVLEIFPISPTVAEIYLHLDHLPAFQATMRTCIVDPSTYTLQDNDLKRRLAAYRMGYFKDLRLAALQDLSPALQAQLLHEASSTPPTVRTRHRNIQASANHDLAALGVSSPRTPSPSSPTDQPAMALQDPTPDQQ